MRVLSPGHAFLGLLRTFRPVTLNRENVRFPGSVNLAAIGRRARRAAKGSQGGLNGHSMADQCTFGQPHVSLE